MRASPSKTCRTGRAREIAGIGGVTVLVAASDGLDGNSDATGAVVAGYTRDSVIR